VEHLVAQIVKETNRGNRMFAQVSKISVLAEAEWGNIGWHRTRIGENSLALKVVIMKAV
jgi:hypothetical protein